MRKLLLTTILTFIFVLGSCSSNNDLSINIDYRQSMRDLVQGISEYAKEINPNFLIIPQNGLELLTENGEETGEPVMSYLNAIDGVGQEDLLYGYDEDNVATSMDDQLYLKAFLDIAEASGVESIVTDYAFNQSYIDNSYSENLLKNYISFAADHRELDNIPSFPVTPYNVNSNDITTLCEAKNFLYLLNTDLFSSKEEYLTAIQNTNYDLIIIDLFYFDNLELNESDIESLKLKSNGGTRLVIAYMSIGEAEDYRYYWNSEWLQESPSWLEDENPYWEGNYKVKYWEETWQSIIYGNSDSYLKKILDAGFDGVYLDIIDAYEYFEE